MPQRRNMGTIKLKPFLVKYYPIQFSSLLIEIAQQSIRKSV